LQAEKRGHTDCGGDGDKADGVASTSDPGSTDSRLTEVRFTKPMANRVGFHENQKNRSGPVLSVHQKPVIVIKKLKI
jgi:hypothetical protein